MENNNTINIVKLAISVIICQVAGLSSAFFTMPAVDSWYQTINKPFFTPPNWIFAPVWVLLFLFMGVSLFFVWRAEPKDGDKKIAVAVFTFQFVLNVLWSFMFFGLRSFLGGFIEIIALWIMILFTMATFSKISKTATYLLVPYIIWVTFAAVLNFTIMWIN